MSVWANIGGTWRKGVLWQNVGGVWRKGVLCGNVAGAWKKDPNPGGVAITAMASPDAVYGSVSRLGAATVRTNSTTVTPTNGTPPYTYAWAAQPDWTIATPADASTNFASAVSPGQDKDTVFICTVTDARGAVTTTSVYAGVSNYYSGGGNANSQ